MATTIQPRILPLQACLPSAKQIALSPNQSAPPVAPTPSQLAGGDVVNLIIAIAVLVKVVLGKPQR